MAINLDIKLKKDNRVYHEGDILRGLVLIDTKGECSHNGLFLSADADVKIQHSVKSEPNNIELFQFTSELLRPGKLSAGHYEFPFDVHLIGTSSPLYETYHGVYISIQYVLTAELKRSFLSKSITKQCEFMIEDKPDNQPKLKPLNFTMDSTRLPNHSLTQAPATEIKCSLDSVICPINHPFTGKLRVNRSEGEVRSIELRLMRIESSSYFNKQVSEIQNIQIADGDVCRNLDIPIYMVFPRLFTRPSLTSPPFNIEFQVDLVVVWQDDMMLSEKVPICLTRS